MKQRKTITMIGAISLCLLGGLTLWLFRQNPDKPAPKLVQELNQVLSLETPTTDQLNDDVPMVVIPAGEFIMGLDSKNTAWWQLRADIVFRLSRGGYQADFAEDEWPEMVVYLDTFEIDQYEVTYERYQQCVTEGVCSPLKQFDERLKDYYKAYHDPNYPHNPVVVTHQAAQTYCKWTGKRLPYEAEWEKAARGTDGRLYLWGDDWQKEKQFNIGCQAEPVGSYPDDVSPYGVWDMMGNVSEWLSNPYETYPHSLYSQPEEDGFLAIANPRLVYRGRRCPRSVIPDLYYRLTNRQAVDDGNQLAGFRCTRGPEPPPLAEAMVSANIPTQPPPLTEVDLSQMVEIPAGEFIMGGEGYETSPLRTVYLDTFYIDQYETTYTEYFEFLNVLDGNHYACNKVTCVEELRILDENEQFEPLEGEEKYPVTEVTWEGADAYCRWRGKRLPTNAEWEKAARGTDGRLYSWGNDLGLYSNNTNIAVGSSSNDVSPYGVWDTVGSAREWIADESGIPEGHHTIRGTGYELFVYGRGPNGNPFQAGVRCAYTP